jgi:hypothetical protein
LEPRTSCLAAGGCFDDPKAAPVTPLRHAHAHNDYAHQRPLMDALEQGFCSVEADIFLVKDELLVGHTVFDLKPERTLQKLYLEPLRDRIKANKGKVYPGGPAIFLLIDVKTEAKQTYAVLDKALASYSDILSVVRDGKFEEKAVTVVISGNTAHEAITSQPSRFAAIDGRPADVQSTVPTHLMPWISTGWSSMFTWEGEGPMPEAEQAKLKEFVSKAHAHGRLVRFWATPETTALWKELRSAGVDLLNTDKLAELKRFLLENDAAAKKP